MDPAFHFLLLLLLFCFLGFSPPYLGHGNSLVHVPSLGFACMGSLRTKGDFNNQSTFCVLLFTPPVKNEVIKQMEQIFYLYSS